jgi:transcriptional regulator with XRE-family HTH domain
VPTFGQRLRELRRAKRVGQRALAGLVGVSFTYVSRIKNGKLGFAPYPSDDLIRRLAIVLDAGPDQLLLLTGKTVAASGAVGRVHIGG